MPAFHDPNHLGDDIFRNFEHRRELAASAPLAPGAIIDPRTPTDMRARLTGIVGRKDLAQLGFTSSRHIREGIQTGHFQRVAHGKYALPHAHTNFRTAARKNSRVACLTACQMYGLWVNPPAKLHVAVHRSAPSPFGANLSIHRMDHPPSEPIVDLRTALTQVCSCTDPESALITLESALNNQLTTEDDLPELTAHAPVKTREILARAVSSSQSGSETRVRNFFHSIRVPVRSQVPIPTVGSVDLVVGTSLIVECDSVSHHSSPENFHNDRVRDTNAMMLGYRVIRLSYEQIWHDWENTRGSLIRVIRTRLHQRTPIPM